MTPLRLRLAGLTASLALLAPATALVTAAPAAAAVADDSAAILLTSVSPAAVTPDDDLVVTGRVTNSGTAALPPLRLTLRLGERLLVERSDVRTWISRGEVDGDLRRLPGAAPVAALPPGASAAFRITVPAGELGLPRARPSFGPRGIAVEATAGEDDDRAGLTRSTIVWYPGKEFQPTKLTLLAPVTAPLDADPAAPEADLAAAMAPGGSLRRILEATGDPLVGWALDPALLSAAQSLTGEEEADEDDKD